MKRSLILISFIIVTLFGCASAPRPTATQLQHADYGKYPSNYLQIIKEAISPILIDPYSAVYKLSIPKKGYNNMINGIIYGWNICGTVNAKNRFGGYVGPKPIYVMIKDDVIVRLLFQGLTIPDSGKMGILSGLMDTAKSADMFCKD